MTSNSLAKRFGITFQADYLYNTVDYDINFLDIFIRDFAPDEITRDLSEITLYTASSIQTTGSGLGFTDANTRSSLLAGTQSFYSLAKSGDGRVLAVSDLTFMISPQSSVSDNDRLISNIADFLTVSHRSFDLADFPHFLETDVDILLGRAFLFREGTMMKNLLSDFQISSEIRGVEDLTSDTVFVGLYQDSPEVVQYLDVAGVQIDDTLRTPFTPDIPIDGTGVVLLHRTQQRQVLVILAHSQEGLLDIISRLGSAVFRNGLVSDVLGVYSS